MILLKTTQVKGVILEEFVLRLLASAGYRILDGNKESAEIKIVSGSLHLQGRGDWHQTDALVSYDHTPAFIYPVRLIVEAKAFSSNSRNNGKVGLNVVRNAVGVLKDVNENYFSFSDSDSVEHKIRRFNYTYAIFSLNGFTKSAQKYAIAHQIFLIQYYYHNLFSNVRRLFEELENDGFHSDLSLSDVRAAVRAFFASSINDDIESLPKDLAEFVRSLKRELSKIQGSYFGLLNGEYPIHILSKSRIGDVDDEVEVEIYLPEPGLVKLRLNDSELFFELPHYLAQVFDSVWKDRYMLANTKLKHINYISLTGYIAGKQRNIILKLNRSWLGEYIERLKRG